MPDTGKVLDEVKYHDRALVAEKGLGEAEAALAKARKEGREALDALKEQLVEEAYCVEEFLRKVYGTLAEAMEDAERLYREALSNRRAMVQRTESEMADALDQLDALETPDAKG
jgi:NTP pyrophosphatase (non-canonical NTP hydrolase)